VGESNDHAIARDAAERYFAALASEIPFDTAPGDVDLIAAVNDIHDAIIDDDRFDDPKDFEKHLQHRESAALHAGYLLGIEIGRRMGGAR
jgi:hypothetical protein